MKTLHIHLLRQVAAALVMSLGVFVGVLLLGNALREVLVVLVTQRAPLGFLLEAIGLLIPYVLVYALPMALLTATLLVMGRFSADQELTAARASGVSLLVLVAPVVLLSAGLAGVCAWVNLQVAPAARVAYKDLLFRLVTDRPLTPFVGGRFVTDFPGVAVYVGRVEGNMLEDVLFYEMSGDEIVRDLRAPRAYFRLDEAARKVVMEFPSATALYWVPRESAGGAGANEAVATNRVEATNGTGAAAAPAGAPSFTAVAAGGGREGYWLPATATELTAEFSFDLERAGRRRQKYSEMTFWQLWLERAALSKQGIPNLNPVSVQLHKQVAMSFACVGFCLVGIPLGIRAHRRETTAGIAMALVLALLYYAFVILGEALATRSGVGCLVAVWFPNFLFQGLGGWWLWRANRGM